MTDELANPLIDAEAEQGVLGALLLCEGDLELVQSVRQLLPGPEHFAAARHRIVYAAICALIDRRVAVDVLTLRDHLRAEKVLEEAGGVEAVAQLADAVPTAANATFHARIVRELSDRRAMAQHGERLMALAKDRQVAVTDILATVVHDLSKATVLRRGRAPRSWTTILLDAGSAVEDQLKRKSGYDGVITRLLDLDRILDGAKRGELLTIAARPSIGKTALALKMARNAALQFHEEAEGGEPLVALIASKEMGTDDLVQRLLTAESGTPIRKRIREGQWRDEDFTKLAKAQHRLNKLPVRIMDTEDYDLSTPGKIRMAVEHFQVTEKCKVGYLVIDYFQLLHADATPGQPVENRNRELGEVAQALKEMGLQLGFPVVLLAQLNRENERANREPRMSDLRDSGELEQVTDKCVLLHAPDSADWEPGKVKAIVAKNRNGETGWCDLAFDKFTQSWRGWSKLADDVSRGSEGLAA